MILLVIFPLFTLLNLLPTTLYCLVATDLLLTYFLPPVNHLFTDRVFSACYSLYYPPSFTVELVVANQVDRKRETSQY